MSLPLLLAFLGLIAFGAYVQTVTGFAFGLIVMGGVGLSGAVPLPDAAVVVSLLVLVNAAQILRSNWRSAFNREFWLVLASSLPTLIASYALLEWLAADNLDLLRIALGAVILFAAVQLVLPGAALAQRSSDGSFVLAGIAGGVLSGLFATSGPPLVYHLYRQPFPLQRIRETLVAVFAVNSVFRVGVVAASGNLSASVLWLSALAVPSVAGATWLARRWPPALSPRTMRRLVFLLLALSGLSLALPALVKLV
jgi:uncharacterized protein